MTGVTDSFRLAPAGVVRAAAWPLPCLAGFGDPELGERARDGAAHGAADADFERRYQQTLARESEYLWTATIEDPRFGKALALASPSAYARVFSAAARRKGPRNRAMRLAEHTLYRYLARAAGRSTPHGLWAGVTEFAFGERTRVESMAPHYAFAPDLRAFQSLLRALGARPEYRSDASWRVNPTFHSVPEGGWIFFSRLGDGSIVHRSVDPHAELSQALPILAGLPPMSLDRLALEISQGAAWPHTSRRDLFDMLNVLADAGALVGGLDLPTKFETPWAALRHAADDLRAAERSAWTQTVRDLEEQCGALSSGAEALSTEAFVARLARSRECVASLAETYGLSRCMPAGQVLRCDLHLPWRVTLDQAHRRAILDALEDYDTAWLRGASPASAERESTRSNRARRMADGVPIGQAIGFIADEPGVSALFWPKPQEVTDPELAARIRTWETCLESPGESAVLVPQTQHDPVAASPLGSLFIGLSEDFGITVRSVADLPTLASARFGHVLDDRSLNDWLRTEIAATIAKTGIALAELYAPFEGNPNVLAGPSLLGHALDPWGASTDSLSLVGAKMCVHPPSGRLVLELAGSRQPWAVLTLRTADMRSRDPLSQLLLGTGFHEFPNRRQRALDIPTASEMARPRFAPRVMLPHGAVLRPRRTLLSDLTHLLRARGSERFRAWQDCARELGWPEHLRVSAGAGESMRIHRDSPLGVEALFKGIGTGTPFIVVEEAAANEGLQVPGGGAYVAELALPFVRQGSSSHVARPAT